MRAGDLQELRAVLPGRLRSSPRDFIRGVRPDEDRLMWAEHLTRSLPEEDDLRFLLKTAAEGYVCVLAERLAWDSEFFGYGVARLHSIVPIDGSVKPTPRIFAVAIPALLDLARRKSITYLFGIVDARDTILLQSLCAAGFVLIESRCSYWRDLRAYSHERFACRLATPADVDVLAGTACEMVNPYDRFHADPFVGEEAAARLMAAWVRASILDGFADATVVPDVAEPRAFSTVRFHRESWSRLGIKAGQHVFGAVHHSFRGWYAKLFSETNYLLKELGADTVFVTTQLANNAAIRSCEKLGYAFGRGEHVFRIVL
jgi:dTDP-4-amino-4,6-dideoxy-D-galactose acyltransferase